MSFTTNKSEYILMNKEHHQIKKPYITREILINGEELFINGEYWVVVSCNGEVKR